VFHFKLWMTQPTSISGNTRYSARSTTTFAHWVRSRYLTSCKTPSNVLLIHTIRELVHDTKYEGATSSALSTSQSVRHIYLRLNNWTKQKLSSYVVMRRLITLAAHQISMIHCQSIRIRTRILPQNLSSSNSGLLLVATTAA
jgi:hypothetical protein